MTKLALAIYACMLRVKDRIPQCIYGHAKDSRFFAHDFPEVSVVTPESGELLLALL